MSTDFRSDAHREFQSKNLRAIKSNELTAQFESMSDEELIAHIDSLKTSIHDWKESLWQASQARRSRGVFNATREIDRLVEQRRIVESVLARRIH